MPELF